MRLRPFVLGLCLGASFAPTVSGALAEAQGGSGYSGTLSSNKAIRKQQLICDPVDPVEGSTSVSYEPDKVTLSGYQFGPGYTAGGPSIPGTSTPSAGYVGITFGEGTVYLEPIELFFQARGEFTETGYVQIFFQSTQRAHGQLPSNGANDDYFVVDEDHGVTGTQGIDTHELFFDPVNQGGVTFGSRAAKDDTNTYTIFGATDNTYGNNSADFLSLPDGSRITAPNLIGVTVSGSFVPEPSTAALALVGVGGLLSRRRRRAARVG